MKLRACTLIVALVVAMTVTYAVAQDPQAAGTTASSQNVPPANQNDKKATPDEPVPQVAKPPKETHDGGKNDIDAIGNRKVGSGGKGLGNWYSLESDIKIGKSMATQIEASARMVKDPVVTEYINRIGQNLVRNSDA